MTPLIWVGVLIFLIGLIVMIYAARSNKKFLQDVIAFAISLAGVSVFFVGLVIK